MKELIQTIAREVFNKTLWDVVWSRTFAIAIGHGVQHFGDAKGRVQEIYMRVRFRFWFIGDIFFIIVFERDKDGIVV